MFRHSLIPALCLPGRISILGAATAARDFRFIQHLS